MVNKRPLVVQGALLATHRGPLGVGMPPKEAQNGHWDQIIGCREAPRATKEAPRCTKEAPRRLKKDPGTKSLSARRHQGSTREAPRSHRGGTKDHKYNLQTAPSNRPPLDPRFHTCDPSSFIAHHASDLHLPSSPFPSFRPGGMRGAIK